MLADLEQVGADAAKVAAAPVWPVSDAELTDLLRVAHRLQQAAVVLQARLVAQAAGRGLPASQGHRSTTGWLRALLMLDPQPARELVEAAGALRRAAIEQAMLDGRTDARQAAVIAATLEAIPADLAAGQAADPRGLVAGDPRGAATGETADPHGPAVGEAGDPHGPAVGEAGDPRGPAVGEAGDPRGPGARGPGDPDGPESGDPRGPAAPGDLSWIVGEAERTMIAMADRLPAYQLRRVGERILAYVAPQVAERADEAALARQEARAHRRRGLTLSLPVDGLVRVSGVLGAEDAATVHAALHPLCRPQPGDDRTPGQRRADALVEVCRLALRTTELPNDGGEPPQLAVTVAYEPLARALGTAVTDTGHRLSAATVRRLACDARLLPVVLGGAGQILDTGRARRLATGPLRRALHLRDRGCAFPDCDRPPRFADAHHITAWNEGGPTTVDNLVLLCRHHHRHIHDPHAGWQIRLGTDRHPDFIPPRSLDPHQRPRRNLYHPHHHHHNNNHQPPPAQPRSPTETGPP